MHRFAFHGENLWLVDNRLSIFLHFVLHGIHHSFPQDRLRLLFPPALAMLLLRFIFIPFFIQLIPADLFYPMLSGGICGFLLYDLTHFYLHHFEIKNKGTFLSKYKKNLKLHHMRHHFKDGTKGFGVSSKLWDIIFKTQIYF